MIGWTRLVIALFCVLLATLILVPVQLLAMRTGWYSENLARGLWHRINVRALGFRIHVMGEMTPLRPLLIASNHISWTDIEVMASLFDMTFIAKSDIDMWPVIGKLFRLQRPIYVERNRKRKTGEQASEIAKRMDADQPIVLFPEGTTGDGNMILPFKSSLFGAAAMSIENGIRDTRPYPAGRGGLYTHTRRSDGPATQTACGLDRRKRTLAASDRPAAWWWRRC